jgi:hypothetical protein
LGRKAPKIKVPLQFDLERQKYVVDQLTLTYWQQSQEIWRGNIRTSSDDFGVEWPVEKKKAVE